MRLDKLPYRDKPMELRGLPTLYGGEGYWLTALPMPLTSTLQHSPGALAHPGLSRFRGAGGGAGQLRE